MKEAFLWTGLLLLFASGVSAQNVPLASSEQLQNAPLLASNTAPVSFSSASLAPSSDFPAVGATLSSFPSSADPALPQVPVINVTPAYNFQAYGGYTFVRFYALPGEAANRNGVDLSMSYFIKKGLFGVEGAVTGAFGSIHNERSDFAFAGGGPRVRWSAPGGLELWAHGLVGEAHFGPKVASFTQDGLAYEVGGGVDITAHFRRWAYRLEGDMIGTRLYQTTQYSPKISAGIVFKF